MKHHVFFSLLVAACGSASAQTTPVNDTASSGLVWKDATGAVVPVVAGALVGASSEFAVFDMDGNVWKVMDGSAQLAPVQSSLVLAYADPSCATPTFVVIDGRNATPRLTFKALSRPGDPEGDIVRVFRDDAVPVRENSFSFNGSVCAQQGERRLVPISQTTSLGAVPSMPFTQPFRPEYVR